MALTKVTYDLLSAGVPIQISDGVTTSMTTTTTILPVDDTVPTSSEGAEVMTKAITPKSASSVLRVDVTVFGAASTAAHIAAALFKDSDVTAVAAGAHYIGTANKMTGVSFRYYMTAGTTSEIMFKVRAGLDVAGTFTFNGASGARLSGAVCSSSIRITEIAA